MKKFYWLVICMLAAKILAAQSVDPKLDSVLQHTLDSMRSVLGVKSLSAAVQLPNGATWAGTDGVSSIFPLENATSDHAYAIGSVTKTITAACILQLADEGVLSLDDSINFWLDTLPYVNPDITIRQLLRHQSGLFDIVTSMAFNTSMGFTYDSTYELGQVLPTFMEPPLFQPGTGWSYSNTNYVLLGMIIEAATGNFYHDEVRQRFLNPLGMGSTALPPFEVLPSQVANLWFDLDGDNVTDDAGDYFAGYASFNSNVGPAGAYHGTATDMAQWMRALLGSDLLSADMLSQMQSTVATQMPGGTKYGLGIMERTFSGLKGWGHGGDIGYSASVFYFPQKDISIAVLNNDARKNSWELAPVIVALLKTYVECEQAVSLAGEPVFGDLVIRGAPNPFLDRISVSLELPKPVASLEFLLTDLSGRKVWSVPQNKVAAGRHTFDLNGLEAVPSGQYLLQVVADGQLVATAKNVKV